MKKLKLRGWVKKSLVIMLIALSLGLLNIQSKRGIEQCVQNGNDINYCQNGLR